MISTVIGLIGAGLVLLAYFLLQSRRLGAQTLSYLLLNLSGSLAVLYSLTHDWNLGGVIINLFWVGISMMGLVMRMRRTLDSGARDR